MHIIGEVKPGFESVQQLLQKSLSAQRDRNIQLCVYVGDERVIDLCANAAVEDSFSADSLVNIYSSGKSLESILLAIMADKGLVDFERCVSSYWPEFVGGGKDKLTVADVMRHEAGLSKLDVTLTAAQLRSAALRGNSVGALLETHELCYADENSPREYHAITRGWIANEIFRRVEPENKTMGEYLRAQVSEPLGIDVYFDLSPDDSGRVRRVKSRSVFAQMLDCFAPGSQARRIGLTPLELMKRIWAIYPAVRSGLGLKGVLPLEGMKEELFGVFDSDDYLSTQIPSAGAKCSARGLAKLAAAMANGGTVGGQSVLGHLGHQALHAAPLVGKMTIMENSFTQAGLALFQDSDAAKGPLEAGLNEGRGGFYGWMGFGGSVFQWHPEHKIGFAYVPTSLNPIDLFNERGKSYQEEVLKCVRAMR